MLGRFRGGARKIGRQDLEGNDAELKDTSLIVTRAYTVVVTTNMQPQHRQNNSLDVMTVS